MNKHQRVKLYVAPKSGTNTSDSKSCKSLLSVVDTKNTDCTVYIRHICWSFGAVSLSKQSLMEDVINQVQRFRVN